MKTVKTYLVRKPCNIEEVESMTHSYIKYAETVEVAETIELTSLQYDAVCVSPLNDYPFLAGKGGYERRDGHHYRQVVELACEGRKSLYADPSGSAYCRYLGLEMKEQNHD